MSLAEVLVSLAISATLLTAVAAAFSASSQVIEQNDRFNRAVQTGRICINQIMSELRRSQSGVVSADSLELVTASGQKRLYAYDSTAQTLTLSFPDAVPVQTCTMARNVSGVSFSTDGSTVSMTVTATVANNTVTLCGSAKPRRAVVYE